MDNDSDAENNSLTVDLPDEELDRRRDEFMPPLLKSFQGTLFKFIKNVKSASEGCVTD